MVTAAEEISRDSEEFCKLVYPSENDGRAWLVDWSVGANSSVWIAKINCFVLESTENVGYVEWLDR